MSIERVEQFRRTARIAYSRHPLARLHRAWRRFAGDPSRDTEDRAADVLLLPLVGLLLTLLLLGTVPGASDAIAAACSAACMP